MDLACAWARAAAPCWPGRSSNWACRIPGEMASFESAGCRTRREARRYDAPRAIQGDLCENPEANSADPAADPSSWAPASAGSAWTKARGLLATLPTNRDILFWAWPHAAFRAMDRIALLAKGAAAPSGQARPLPSGRRSRCRWTSMPTCRSSTAAVLIVHGASCGWSATAWASTAAGAGPAFRWPSPSPRRWSGAAMRTTAPSRAWTTRSATITDHEGLGLRRRQHPPAAHHDLGVRWNEDYADPTPTSRASTTTSPRPAWTRWSATCASCHAPRPPGTRWNYSTGETNLVGILITRRRQAPPTEYPAGKDLGAGIGMSSRPPGCSKTGQDQRLLHPGHAA